MDTKHMNNPTEAITSPNATYRASENFPSVRQLLPTPKLSDVVRPEPEASIAPATFSGNDHAQVIVRDDQAVTLDVRTKQQTDLSPLQRPRRFNPSTRQFEEVALPPVDDAKPATARPVHDVSKAQNR